MSVLSDMKALIEEDPYGVHRAGVDAHLVLLMIIDAAQRSRTPLSRALLLAIRGSNPELVDACLQGASIKITR